MALPPRSITHWVNAFMNDVARRGVKLNMQDTTVVEDQMKFWLESALSYELQRRKELAEGI